MSEDLYEELIPFVRRSSNREDILTYLKNEGPATPTDIAEETGMHRNHVSNRLSELREKGLVEVTNPEDSHHRYYRIKDKGKEVLEEL
ncbi:MAG: winged helix-turn-helix domain-containing protein [Candidatus Nanohaloarchaea archaeon]